MRSYLILPCIVLACAGAPSSEQNVTLPDDVPANAIREKFADNSKMEKIIVKDAQGALSMEGILVNGKKEGVWTEFNANGTAKKVTPYINGVKEGWLMTSNENGTFVSRAFYHNDVRNGEYREYFYTTVIEESMYVNDKLEGLSKKYTNNGKVQQELSYKNGILDGVSKWYNEEGKMTIEYEYKDGKLIKQ